MVLASIQSHLRGSISAVILFPVVAAVVGAVFTPLPLTASTDQRVEQAILSALIGIGFVALLLLTFAVLVAPYEQRRALRNWVEAHQSHDGLIDEFHFVGAPIDTRVNLEVSPHTLSADVVIRFLNESTVAVKQRVESVVVSIEGNSPQLATEGLWEAVVLAGREARFDCGTIHGIPFKNPIRGRLAFSTIFGPASSDAFSYRVEETYQIKMTIQSPTAQPIGPNAWSIGTTRVSRSAGAPARTISVPAISLSRSKVRRYRKKQLHLAKVQSRSKTVPFRCRVGVASRIDDSGKSCLRPHQLLRNLRSPSLGPWEVHQCSDRSWRADGQKASHLSNSKPFVIRSKGYVQSRSYCT